MRVLIIVFDQMIFSSYLSYHIAFCHGLKMIHFNHFCKGIFPCAAVPIQCYFYPLKIRCVVSVLSRLLVILMIYSRTISKNCYISSQLNPPVLTRCLYLAATSRHLMRTVFAYYLFHIRLPLCFFQRRACFDPS